MRACLAVAAIVLSGAASRPISAQVELTPIVGAYFPTKRVGYRSSQGNGLRVESVTERGDGILIGARAGWWFVRYLGVEGAATTSSHSLRELVRMTDLNNGFITDWRTQQEFPDVRANAFSARLAARWTPRGGPLTVLGGLGVAHVRWRHGSTDASADNGTGLSYDAAVRYRLSDRAGVRVDVENAGYSLRSGAGARQQQRGLGLTFGYSLTFRR